MTTSEDLVLALAMMAGVIVGLVVEVTGAHAARRRGVPGATSIHVVSGLALFVVSYAVLGVGTRSFGAESLAGAVAFCLGGEWLFFVMRRLGVLPIVRARGGPSRAGPALLAAGIDHPTVLVAATVVLAVSIVGGLVLGLKVTTPVMAVGILTLVIVLALVGVGARQRRRTREPAKRDDAPT